MSETVEAGPDPVATDTDNADYLADMDKFEGATEDGTPEESEWDNESGTAT